MRDGWQSKRGMRRDPTKSAARLNCSLYVPILLSIVKFSFVRVIGEAGGARFYARYFLSSYQRKREQTILKTYKLYERVGAALEAVSVIHSIFGVLVAIGLYLTYVGWIVGEPPHQSNEPVRSGPLGR